jgi:hypothetical protein
MDRTYMIGVFERKEDALDATEMTRLMGYDIHDVYTPYAVHGLPEAMGLKPSRLTWACFVFALTGFSAAILAQFWVAGIDWPLNIGGKPFNSLPAYLPVMFECIVLFGGVGVTLAMLLRTGTLPGKRPIPHFPEATDHRFLIAVERKDSSFDARALTALWGQFHAVDVRDLREEEA